MAFLDIDGFKAVNDQHGHALGDEVLVQLASLLAEHTRDADVVGRLGGDEFAIVASDCPPSAAAAMAERLLAAVRVHDWHGLAADLTVRVSIGVASGDHDHDQLFVRPDEALYAAKRGGRDRAEVVVLERDGS